MVSRNGGGGEIASPLLTGYPTSLEMMLTRARILDSIDHGKYEGKKVKLGMKMSAFRILK